MREIKFRGKSLLGLKPMIKGHYFYNEITDKHNIIWNPQDDSPQVCPIDENTVGQFTGLKDKNGVEIYEGDILSDENLTKGIVKYDNYEAAFLVDFSKNDIHNLIDVDTWAEVIGNIYENPELL